jgi:N-acetylneuraminic acid mutarotase
MIWTKLDDSAVRGTIPCARSGHRFTVFGTNILMFGGGQWDDKTEQWLHKFNDLFIFDTLKMKWRQPKTRGNAEVCTFPSVSRMGYHMVVFGGQSMASNWTTNNLYILDTVTLEWNEVEFAKDSYKPRCRDMASLTLVNNNTAVLFGGNHGGAQNDWNILRINWKVGDFLYRRPTTAPTNANSTGQN